MDRLQRIYKLHQAVSSRRHPVSCQTLQDELECSRATVNRIIQEMRLYFNAPIEYDRSRNGYHYALNDGQTFELPGLWFSETELYALLTTQQLLTHVQPGLLDTQLKPVKDRIEQILATRHLGSEEISKRVRILRMSGRNVAPECFQTVAGALLQRNSLRISYHGRGNNETSSRDISPQRLIHYRDNWYLGRLVPYPQRPAQLRRRTHHRCQSIATALPRRFGKTARCALREFLRHLRGRTRTHRRAALHPGAGALGGG